MTPSSSPPGQSLLWLQTWSTLMQSPLWGHAHCWGPHVYEPANSCHAVKQNALVPVLFPSQGTATRADFSSTRDVCSVQVQFLSAQKLVQPHRFTSSIQAGLQTPDLDKSTRSHWDSFPSDNFEGTTAQLELSPKTFKFSISSRARFLPSAP